MTAQLTDIKVFQEYKGVNKGKWSIYDRVTGKTIHWEYYPTEETAREAIPTAYESYLKRVEYLEQQHATAKAKQEAATRAHEERHAELSRGRNEHGTYTTTRDGGRRYTNLPGAVHYDDNGNGRYSTQIWDEA